ncbi:MAG: winged helix-turn-helix domain-containing protein, partial [Dehalococcoidia bacterium]|nr:winged helix-turn-helix domain-containing protein [Dehalococcoidia bacterium]
LTDTPPEEAQALLQGGSVPERTGTIAIVGRERLPDIEADLSVDDFAVFPAPADELAARIRRVARRRAGEEAHLLHCGDLTIDQASYRVYVGSRPVELTYKEYELLRFLALNQDKVCTRETLLNRVWGYDFYGGARTVDVHVRRLRGKIEDSSHSLIETVRNVGYRLRAG